MDTKNFILYVIIFICSISLGVFLQFQCSIIKKQPVTVEVKPDQQFFEQQNVPVDSADVLVILKQKYPAKQAYYKSTTTFRDSNYTAEVQIISIEPLPPDLIAGIDFKLMNLPVGECNCDETFIDDLQEASLYIVIGEILLLAILWSTGAL